MIESPEPKLFIPGDSAAHGQGREGTPVMFVDVLNLPLHWVHTCNHSPTLMLANASEYPRAFGKKRFPGPFPKYLDSVCVGGAWDFF